MELSVSPFDNRFFIGNCVLRNDLLMKSVEECWHLRQNFHAEDQFRVPVPTTHQGKCVFFSNIVACSNTIPTMIHWREVKGHNHVEVRFRVDRGMPIAARFAEVVVCGRRQLLPSEWNIIGIRALPEKDVPLEPLKIVELMNDSMYRFTLDDLVKATIFWSQHGLTLEV